MIPTALWSDAFYSGGKSFQPSFDSLLAMLLEDVHSPIYYGLLWLWGHPVGQTPVSLRLFSWLAYLAGGLVVLRLMLISCWGPGFSELDAGVVGMRQQDQFCLISRRTSGL